MSGGPPPRPPPPPTMDYDAYSSFVAVDVEARRPLVRVCLVGGSEYADTSADSRTSLELLKRAYAFWEERNSSGGPSFSVTVHLGDLLSANALLYGAPDVTAEQRVAGGTPLSTSLCTTIGGGASESVTHLGTPPAEEGKGANGEESCASAAYPTPGGAGGAASAPPPPPFCHTSAGGAAALPSPASPEAALAAREALASVRELMARHGGAPWHVALGDHERLLAATGALGLAELAPLLPPAGAPAYYAFTLAAGWRGLLLDALDVSLLSSEPAAREAALGVLRRENPAVAAHVDAGGVALVTAAPLAALEGHARRFGPRGGGLSEAQLGWLREQLSLAEEAGERAIVFCHLGCLRDGGAPEGLLFNCDEARAAIDSFAGVVAAWVSAGAPEGSYARDTHGVHHITLCAAGRCAVNEDGFGMIDVHEGHLSLRMVGRPPDPVTRPQGWPETLALPRGGGALVAAPTSGGAVTGLMWMFVSMWMSLLSALLVPIEPLFRMLTDGSSTTAREEEGGDRGGSVPLVRVPVAASASDGPAPLAPPLSTAVGGPLATPSHDKPSTSDAPAAAGDAEQGTLV